MGTEVQRLSSVASALRSRHVAVSKQIATRCNEGLRTILSSGKKKFLVQIRQTNRSCQENGLTLSLWVVFLLQKWTTHCCEIVDNRKFPKACFFFFLDKNVFSFFFHSVQKKNFKEVAGRQKTKPK